MPSADSTPNRTSRRPPPKAIAKAKPPAAASATGTKSAGTRAQGESYPLQRQPRRRPRPNRRHRRCACRHWPNCRGDLRQQVPALVIGGSVYSPQASARMVVVNGQVFQEGSSLAPELKLEQIRQKAAVFSIRGQRFEVPL